MKKLPPYLKKWFVIHFIVDMLFAIPLMISPTWLLDLFRLSAGDGVAARLVAAALIGIGGVSFLMRHKSAESYDTMLTLKLLWSASAAVGIAWSIVQGADPMAWVLVGIFAVFFVIWAYYLRLLKSA